MIDRVNRTVARYAMLGDRRVVAAVSGGPDSVCLLHVLRETGAKLAGVAHFNHKLRGQESEQDERFVAALAARFELPFFCGSAHPERGNLEQSARRARREFFLQLMRDGASDRVALGHTLDDQAETVLFRILRGSGLAGLAGIHPVTEDGFIRPLIEVRREEAREFLRSRGIEWREDSSNRDPRFARNRIRNALLPQLRREWNPRIDDALAQLADLAFEEERWLGGAAGRGGEPAFQPAGEVLGRLTGNAKRSRLDSRLAATTGGPTLDVEGLAAMPRGLARRVIREAIRQAKGDLRGIGFQHVEQILEMRPGRLRVPGLTAVRSFGRIRLGPLPTLDAVEVTLPGIYEQAGIRLKIGETPEPGCANLKVDLARPIVLRGWRPGDHYRPVGKSRDQKVKEMFQKARIPSWQRRGWPMLESEGKVLWASRFGVAGEFEVNGRRGPVLQIWDLADES